MKESKRRQTSFENDSKNLSRLRNSQVKKDHKRLKQKRFNIQIDKGALISIKLFFLN